MNKLLIIYLLFLLMFTAAKAQSHSLPPNDQWLGGERKFLTIAGHTCWYVVPNNPLPGKPWVWRASFPEWHTTMDSILITKGFCLAYLEFDNQYGSPAAMQVWDKFYNYLVDSVKLNPSVSLEAVSRGALYALAWAKRNPDKVNCIYAETPVYNIKSWPGGKGKGPGDTVLWRQLKQVFHFTEQQAMAFNDNPVDQLDGLAAFKVPVLNVISLADQIAPFEENALLFAERYIRLGGPVTTIPINDGPQELSGHHFPIKHAGNYASFIIENSFPVKTKLPYVNYFDVRDGLGNFYKTAVYQKKATVAFLGGSITYNPGWRDKVSRFLTERFPETEFHFIAAGIPSLGSLPHAFRLQRDVLDSARVDLLFIEAAVNDRVNGTDSLTQIRDLEGIVLHARQNNPLIDIALMEFIDPSMFADFKKGAIPIEVYNHELVATHYKLPSLNLAQEINDKLNNQEFSWAADFKDVHPAIYGQELYFENIKKMLESSFVSVPEQYTPAAKVLPLPVPLNPASFTKGNYFSIRNAKFDSDWTFNEHWQPADGLSVREGFVNVPVLVAEKPGARLSLAFKGTAIGVAIVSGGDAGIIEYSIDKKPYRSVDLYTQWSGFLHLPWYIMLDGNLHTGNHVLKLRTAVTKNPNSKGNACRIVYFIKNG